VLVHQGDSSGDLFAVIQGRLKVTTSSPEGENVVFSILGPGEVFGEIALLDGGTRSATVMALETCRLLIVPRAAFLGVLRDFPSLAFRLLETMAKRIRTLSSRTEESLLDVPTRLARTLIALAARFGAPAGRGHVRVTIKLRQRELGDLIGATREMVNKCLAVWKRRRLVEHVGGVLLVLNHDRLQAIAEGSGPVRRSTPKSSRRGQRSRREATEGTA
jgi:CRP-like cAMP-binding protein